MTSARPPLLTPRFVALCLGVNQLPVAFKKGGVAWLRGQPIPGGYELAAMMPPKVLVKL